MVKKRREAIHGKSHHPVGTKATSRMAVRNSLFAHSPRTSPVGRHEHWTHSAASLLGRAGVGRWLQEKMGPHHASDEKDEAATLRRADHVARDAHLCHHHSML